MVAVELDDQRCEKCQKLLFRGILGMGIVEVKCPRCGHISRLHSIEAILRGKTHTYVLVYNHAGKIILSSESARTHLHYTAAELNNLHIQDISLRNHPPILEESSSTDALHAWEEYHTNLSSNMVHRTKRGEILKVRARFYPIAAYTGYYTVAVYDVV